LNILIPKPTLMFKEMNLITYLVNTYLSGIGQEIAAVIKEAILEVFNALTPIIQLMAIAMIGIGLLMAALRQEFLAYRLISGGVVALVLLYVVLPYVLGWL